MQNKSLEALEKIGEAYSGIYNCCSDIRTDYEEEYNTIKQDLECLEILKKHTHINKNGDGFTITIWFNTNNCDFKSCPTMEECLFVKEVLSK